jgi:hypothetical protein|tara:strand:- start:26 stop:190 length:165 start_codon:yes stop_codon:yes gene_type:complete
MLSIEKCLAILNRGEKQYSLNDSKLIRNQLYLLAEDFEDEFSTQEWNTLKEKQH